MLILAEFNFKIVYTKGTANGRADALSRREDYRDKKLKELNVIFNIDDNRVIIPRIINMITKA